MNAPRVLVSGVVLGQPAGGVRRHNAELLPRLARRLDERGGGLAVLEGRDRIAFDLPVCVERIASEVPSGPPIARAAAEGFALRSALDAARRAGRPFDVVHTAHFPVPRSIPVPFTLTIHDLRALVLPETSTARRLLAGPLMGGAARRAARVFTVSRASARDIRAHLRVTDACVIGNGGDHFVPLPREPRAGSALPRGSRAGSALPRGSRAGAPLVHLGHLEPRKNVDVLLAALALDPGLPDLELWGAPKPDEIARLTRIATRLGIAARVHFRGAYAEEALPRILATCAAAVLPSKLEGFGIGVLEAHRARAPLAIADAGALPEIAAPDTPRFPPDDARACVAAIRNALELDDADLDRAAAHAALFTWDLGASIWCEALCAIALPRTRVDSPPR